MNFYNDIKRECTDLLSRLIQKGAIAPGTISTKSIHEILPIELTDFNQCHFFAGIGGWPYALDLAGVPRDADIWTGSCPCQPFSTAGKKRGTADSRHLWPEFFRLIRECRPSIIFGEQVASAAALSWWDTVASDLESEAYAVAAASLCAYGVGSPHQRQRLYWVAYSLGIGRSQWISDWHKGRSTAKQSKEITTSENFGAWVEYDTIQDSEGRSRPIKPGVCPVVDGVRDRVERLKISKALRGYGNAIVPPLAAEFVVASLESIYEQKRQNY